MDLLSSLTASLTSGTQMLAGETVEIEKRAVGATTWTPVTTTTTHSKRPAVATVVPGTREGRKEQYMTVFPGTHADKRSTVDEQVVPHAPCERRTTGRGTGFAQRLSGSVDGEGDNGAVRRLCLTHRRS